MKNVLRDVRYLYSLVFWQALIVLHCLQLSVGDDFSTSFSVGIRVRFLRVQLHQERLASRARM